MYIIICVSPIGNTKQINRWYFNGFKFTSFNAKPQSIWDKCEETMIPKQVVIYPTLDQAQRAINEDITNVDGIAVAVHCVVHRVVTNPVT